MNIYGLTKNRKKTTLRVNQDYFNLAVVAYSFFIDADAAKKHIILLMKQALYEEKSSDWVKNEIQEEILIYLTINEIKGEE